MKKEQGTPDFVELEKNILKFWEENKSFEKLVKKNAGHARFKFLDGPATANNRLGVHHFWGRVLKDLTIRYNALKGKDCQYQNGFDGQGLWVEVNVEKELGLNGKPEILNYGIDNFTNKCMERVNYFGNEMTNQSIRMGQWMDWENSYYTNTDENITSIWHFLKVCNSHGWIVKKNRPMAWCPRCGTSLSEHEMSSSYHEVEHTAIFAKFPVVGKDFKIVAWTTTPWTLSANVALAVNPEFDYCLVNFHGEKLVIGKDRLSILREKAKLDILDTFKGSELVGLMYETCFPELSEQNFTHKVVAWDEVDNLEGTCVVHIAPGCGAEDFELGQRLGLKEICPINEQGVMLSNTGFLANKKTTDVVDLVVNRLASDNKLLYSHKYKHSYPFCWRCKTDLVYKLISAWFIKMDEIKPMALKAIDEVEFKPEYAKKRMADWLNNMGDWNISRSRFYGLPLPFYICEKCNKVHVIGSLEELKEKAVNKDLVEKIPNLHRPWIDDIKIKCDCGAEISRISEVGDVWLDAGITPFSTKKYFTDKKFFEENFPSDYVCEMIEQIKLWFYSLLVMSVVLTGKAPYKKLVTYQYVKDENGNEFHKSGGNSLDADVVANEVGADAIRYLYASANPTNEMRFGYKLTDEARRKMIAFWNIYTFFNTYASIDNPDIEHFVAEEKNFTNMDKWLIQSVNKFILDSDENYMNDKNYLVVKDFEKLVDDISNFYIRGNRKRFWKSENKVDQMTAYWCLYSAIKAIIRVMSPITPFLTEYIWQNMVREVEKSEVEEIMLSGYPTKIFEKDYANIISNTETVRNIITLAQRLRNEKQIKIKQPLKTLYLTGDDSVKDAVALYDDVIKEELNIKNIEIVHDQTKFNIEYLGLDFRRAGAVLKGDLQRIRNDLLALSDLEMSKLVDEFKNGKVHFDGFDLDSDLFVLNTKPKGDYIIANLDNITVVLDITIDRNLLLEGLSRELIRSAQVLRKDSNFEVSDRINLFITTDSKDLKEVIVRYKTKIMNELLATEFNDIGSPDGVWTGEIAGESLTIKMKKV